MLPLDSSWRADLAVSSRRQCDLWVRAQRGKGTWRGGKLHQNQQNGCPLSTVPLAFAPLLFRRSVRAEAGARAHCSASRRPWNCWKVAGERPRARTVSGWQSATITGLHPFRSFPVWIFSTMLISPSLFSPQTYRQPCLSLTFFLLSLFLSARTAQPSSNVVFYLSSHQTPL